MNTLRADGATTAFNKLPFAIVTPKGLLPLPKNLDECISFDRHLLEWHVRNAVLKQPEVHVIPNIQVLGLLAMQDHARIIGVQTRERGQEGRTATLLAESGS